MAGNVWEWTRSLYEGYPYVPGDGRENPEAGGRRVVRGGAFNFTADLVRCAFRYWNYPHSQWFSFVFRVVVAPFSHASDL
jgi:formylglycine-generating enzyme required for sulfatase activity